MKTPKTLKEAILQTRALHQMVVDGKYINYARAVSRENCGACPLCLYSKYRRSQNGDVRNTCTYCPYTKIQKSSKCKYSDYSNSEQSIERLNCWLEGKPYEPQGENNE